jgi:hypothetical protein
MLVDMTFPLLIFSYQVRPNPLPPRLWPQSLSRTCQCLPDVLPGEAKSFSVASSEGHMKLSGHSSLLTRSSGSVPSGLAEPSSWPGFFPVPNLKTDSDGDRDRPGCQC